MKGAAKMPPNNLQFQEFCEGTLTPIGCGLFTEKAKAKHAQAFEPLLPWVTVDATRSNPKLISWLTANTIYKALSELDVWHNFGAALGPNRGYIRLDVQVSGPVSDSLKILFDLQEPQCLKFLDAAASLGYMAICPAGKADIRHVIGFDVGGDDGLSQRLTTFKAMRTVADLGLFGPGSGLARGPKSKAKGVAQW